MVPADLDLAVARLVAHRGLAAEVDKLPPKVTLVLWHILVERRGQARIIPGRRLRIVINEIHAGCIGKTHFPSTRQWSQLGDRLLLDAVVIGVLSVHSDILLPTWVYPSCGSSIVVDEVSASSRCVSLFPTCRKFTSACCGGTSSHHLYGVCTASA